MSRTNEIDAQAASILRGLSNLQTLLDDPLAQHALDLDENASTAKQYDILRRLLRSLTQYLERDGDLFYVGLLGHFSAGKSSTINSILNLWGSEVERETDLNPTDKTITLITRDNNRGSLLGVIREGHVTIRYQTVDNPFLDNLVLADTPGTGDPHLIGEIARDFLPICDVILFFFSAASPLDQADMPLLTELHKRLQFIPIRFVVTRADELRRDFSRPVSAENIDTVKRTRFFSEVLIRINKLLHPVIYTEEHFILIDNKTSYNIGAVSELIQSKCNPSNTHSRILMHSHKLQYFLKAARELKGFFDRFLEDKLRGVTRIVNTAEQNIERYNEDVRISNNNLTRSWLEQLGEIRGAQEEALKTLPPLSELPLIVADFESVDKRLSELEQQLADEARLSARHLLNTLKLEVSVKVRGQIKDLDLNKVLSAPKDEDAYPRGITLGAFEIESLASISLIPSSLPVKWGQFRDAKVFALRESATAVRKSLDEMSAMIQLRSPWAKCESVVAGAQESLSEDVKRFFRSAELYRTGVFSHATKESIGALGLGAELDALESEFSDADQTLFAAEASRSIFPKFPEISNVVLSKVAIIDKALRPLVSGAKDLKIPSPESTQHSLTQIMESEQSSLFSIVIAELRDDIGRFLKRLEVRLLGAAVERRRAYRSEIAAARRVRWLLYASMIIGAAVLALLGYGIYAYFTEDIPQKVLNTIILNLVAQVVSWFVGFGIAKALDNFPKKSRRIKFEHQSLLRRDLERIADDELRTHVFTGADETKLTEMMTNSVSRLMAHDPDQWDQSAGERLKILREFQSEYSACRAQYMEIVNDDIGIVASYFSDPNSNLQTLKAISDKIKKRAIEPSFELLDRTRESLNAVKVKIHEVEF